MTNEYFMSVCKRKLLRPDPRFLRFLYCIYKQPQILSLICLTPETEDPLGEMHSSNFIGGGDSFAQTRFPLKSIPETIANVYPNMTSFNSNSKEFDSSKTPK